MLAVTKCAHLMPLASLFKQHSLSLYVYAHIYKYMYTYAYTYTYAYVYTYAWKFSYVYKCIPLEREREIYLMVEI